MLTSRTSQTTRLVEGEIVLILPGSDSVGELACNGRIGRIGFRILHPLTNETVLRQVCVSDYSV